MKIGISAALAATALIIFAVADAQLELSDGVWNWVPFERPECRDGSPAGVTVLPPRAGARHYVQGAGPMRDLKNRTALVTGASQGIGVYIARALAAEGMNLILAARSADRLESVAEDLRATGREVLCIPTDLSDRASLAALAERVEGEVYPVS